MNKYLLIIIILFILLLIITVITYYNNNIIENFSSDCKGAEDLGCFISGEKDSWKKGDFCKDQNPLLCFMKRLFCMITVQKCDINTLNNSITQINTQKVRLSESITSLRAEIETLRTSKGALNTQLEELRKTHEQITTEKNSLETQVNSLTTNIETEQGEKAQLEITIGTLRDEIGVLQGDLDDADGEIIELNRQIKNKEAADKVAREAEAAAVSAFGGIFASLSSDTPPESEPAVAEEPPTYAERLRTFENECKTGFKCESDIADKILTNYNQEYLNPEKQQGYIASPYTVTKVGDQECEFNYTFTRAGTHFPESPSSGTGKRTYKFKLLDPDPDDTCKWEFDGNYQTITSPLEKSYTEPPPAPEPAAAGAENAFGFGDTSGDLAAFLDRKVDLGDFGAGLTVSSGGGTGVGSESSPVIAAAPETTSAEFAEDDELSGEDGWEEDGDWDDEEEWGDDGWGDDAAGDVGF